MHKHYLTGIALNPPYPAELAEVQFGMGCFWGAERKFWVLPGVYVTAVGYGGGQMPSPSYEAVCTGRTGHAELVRVVYDPTKIALPELLKVFWESHDPTQGNRQGNDVGTQYRSAIYYTKLEDLAVIEQSRAAYQAALSSKGLGLITTQIAPASPFYLAELYHQQYLAKNPNGYCGLGGTGVTCTL